ncbi:MAG TPA: 3D domain-containing protein [Caulobacteraceae bacterium]|nr:3D domain-containing protein [Caulobacteraceae bacterium]
MKRFLACLATLACALVTALGAASSGAYAEPASPTNPVSSGQAQTPTQTQPQSPAPQIQPPSDPIGDLVTSAITGALPGSADYYLKATLYHAGERGMSALDSLGCRVVAMRTAAVDGIDLPRHTILFIKETVGLPMPNGARHDGYWYASDVGSAIHRGRIDLFTGDGAHSMSPLMPLNLATLTVMKAGVFHGCPPN